MLRRVVFWLHLVSGLVAGLVIGVMSITGVALTFQPQVLEWARRELRSLPPPEDAARLPLEQVLERAQAAAPERRPTAVELSAEPNAAVTVHVGRAERAYVDPWTGEALADPAAGLAAFFRAMVSWHRWLGAEGEGRAVGRAITGACNAAFLFLAVSGLYLWVPRRWRWKALRPVLWFRRGLGGKARDFNWHHVVGFWTLPALVVLTATGLVISYRWASDLVYTAHGEPPPPGGRPGPPKVDVPAPPPGADRVPLDVLVARAREAVPDAERLTLRLGPPGEAAHVTARVADAWPPFSSTTVSLDPYTAETLHRSTFADQTPGRRTRAWLRFLHTGEALGWPGQLVAGLASLGGVLLLYTGVALSVRRSLAFRRRRRRARPTQRRAA